MAAAEVDISIAIGNGSVEHVASPKDLPVSIHVGPPAGGQARDGETDRARG